MASNRLLSRIEKLEAALPPPAQDLVIFRKVVRPGASSDYLYGECDGRSFDRLADESLEDFENRIALTTRPERLTGRGRRALLYRDRSGAA